MGILDAAAEWGTPPWVIAGGGSPLKWFIRYRAYREARIDKDRLDAQELEQSYGR